MVSDTSVSWFAAPNADFNAMMEKTGAVYNGQGWNVMKCNTTGLPDMVFTINGVKYNISPSDYVRDVNILFSKKGKKFEFLKKTKTTNGCKKLAFPEKIKKYKISKQKRKE